MAIIAGLVIDHFHQPWLQLIGMIVGTIICYVLGTAWFCFEVTFVFIDKAGRTGEHCFYEKTDVSMYTLTEEEIDV